MQSAKNDDQYQQAKKIFNTIFPETKVSVRINQEYICLSMDDQKKEWNDKDISQYIRRLNGLHPAKLIGEKKKLPPRNVNEIYIKREDYDKWYPIYHQELMKIQERVESNKKKAELRLQQSKAKVSQIFEKSKNSFSGAVDSLIATIPNAPTPKEKIAELQPFLMSLYALDTVFKNAMVADAANLSDKDKYEKLDDPDLLQGVRNAIGGLIRDRDVTVPSDVYMYLEKVKHLINEATSVDTLKDFFPERMANQVVLVNYALVKFIDILIQEVAEDFGNINDFIAKKAPTKLSKANDDMIRESIVSFTNKIIYREDENKLKVVIPSPTSIRSSTTTSSPSKSQSSLFSPKSGEPKQSNISTPSNRDATPSPSITPSPNSKKSNG